MEILRSFIPFIDNDNSNNKILVVFINNNNELIAYQGLIIKTISKKTKQIYENISKIVFEHMKILNWIFNNKLYIFICIDISCFKIENNLLQIQCELINKVLMLEEANNKQCIFIVDSIDICEFYKKHTETSNRHLYFAKKLKLPPTDDELLNIHRNIPYSEYICYCNVNGSQIKLTDERQIECLLKNYILFIQIPKRLSIELLKLLLAQIKSTLCFPEEKLLVTIYNKGGVPVEFFKNELWIGTYTTITEKLMILKKYKVFQVFLKKHLIFEQTDEIIKGLDDLSQFNYYKYMKN